ncbi:hypothetical protein KC851_01135 [Candidatus Kaiserbacteria bacterium]|nr:hypothetical protein [Candidatus Kaiserbacteria bacterium]
MNYQSGRDKDSLGISWLLTKVGITPSPALVSLIKILIIVIGVIGIIVLNTGDDNAKFGNYDEMKVLYPDEF